jgi:N-alpha-acetyltransferase 30
MLAVQEEYRGKGIGTKLVCMAIDAMKARDADEVCVALQSSLICASKRPFSHFSFLL